MKKASYIFYASLLVLTACSTSKKQVSKAQYSLPVLSETERILKTISSDDFAGRKPGTAGFEKAVDFVENEFRKNGIQPFFSKSFKDTFDIGGVQTYNVVGEIKAAVPTKEYVLVCAHLDHLGEISKAKSGDKIYNGANDNGSGSTAVIQTSKVLKQIALNKNVLVVLFSGEEDGLLGSMHLAHRLKDANVDLKYVVNFEMIGKTLTSGAGQVYVTGYQKSDFAKKVNKIVGKDFIQYLPAEDGYSLFERSDNYPFYQVYHIPSHTLCSFDFENYAYYHQLKDEYTELDVPNMHAIIETSSKALAEMLTTDVSFKLKD